MRSILIRPPIRFQRQVKRTTKAFQTRTKSTKTSRPSKKKRGLRKIRLTAPWNRLQTSRKTRPQNKRAFEKTKRMMKFMKIMSTQTKMWTRRRRMIPTTFGSWRWTSSTKSKPSRSWSLKKSILIRPQTSSCWRKCLMKTSRKFNKEIKTNGQNLLNRTSIWM